jgi:[ribosomal protein S5]-alanine N-acetyltransferase
MNPSKLLPVFETKRLILRGVELSDVPSYQKNFNDYEIISHLSHLVPWPYPDDGVEFFLKTVIMPTQARERWMWAIVEKQNPKEVIGTVDLFRQGIPENRGFWLAKKHWGKGYMTEAVEPVMDFAFNSLNFDKLIFSNALGNERSRRVKEKTGARYVGTKPSKLVDPKYTESELWELTKNEWRKFRKSELPIQRRSTRAVLLTPENEILMMKLENEKMNWVGWITPGGGVEANEDDHTAIRRELHEELGLSDFEIGPLIWKRRHCLHWANQFIEQSENYYLINTEKFDPKPTLDLNEFELEAFKGFKWWSFAEMQKSQEVFAPRSLSLLLSELASKGVPQETKIVW